MNPTLELIARRTSTRTYSPEPVTPAEKDAVLEAAFRAPTGGNMLLYSIIDVEDQALKDRLAITCDDQPFIAKAPWVLVFVADFQKWTDLFDAAGIANRRVPGTGDLMLACSDALIAAQNAVIAAESLGVGSCYIGDILENGEEHAELLGLPAHTFPIAMLCFGHPAASRQPVPRYTDNVAMANHYRRLTAEELPSTDAALARMHSPNGLSAGVATYAEAVYHRKYDSDFMHEMNRSVTWWLDRWQRG